jgi:MYXO-CTERM domain-containing protein
MPGDDGASGCDCALGSASRDGALLPGLLLGALAMLTARRRRRRHRNRR